MRRSFQQQRTLSQSVPRIIATLGFFYYLFSLIRAAMTQISVLDEGLYLFKGWLFSAGIYTPFKPYGPWTNQMPFAFYIPGWIQQIFAPGLMTGRVMAIILGILTFVGLAITLRKFTSEKITAAVLVLFALNSAQTKMFAVATSQGSIAFLLVWMIYLILGKDQKTWQLFFGGLIAGLAVMIRINLILILPIILAYVLWEKGTKDTLWTGLGMTVFFIGGHLLFWPDILQIWAKWLPLPFFSPWSSPKNITTWQPDNPLGFRVASFFLTFRYHFAAVAGGILSLALVDLKKLQQNKLFKLFIFLIVNFLFLYLIHMWAAIFNDYCVFCFPTYVSFFSVTGFLILGITIQHVNLSTSLRAKLGIFFTTIILMGIAYSAEGEFLDTFGGGFYKWIYNLPIPFTNAVLWQVIANKFSLEQSSLSKITNSLFPTLIVLAAILFLAILLKIFTQRVKLRSVSYSSILLLSLFMIPALLAPIKVLAGGYNSYDCDEAVVANYDEIGKEISDLVPAGSSLYWAGYSPVTLLHLPQAKIYPAQLHSGYSYRISDDSDALLQYGWWNELLAIQWAQNSDMILLEAKNLEDVSALTNGFEGLELIYSSAPQNCRPNSEMLLYRRK